VFSCLPNIILLIILSISLWGCGTISSNEDHDRQKAAAKINARLGMAYLEQHDVIRAKQKFLLAMQQGPSLPETWYSMAYFLETTGNKEKAKIHYLKAIQLEPDRGDTLNNYGTFLCRAGDYPGAIQQFLKATQDPTYLEVAAAYENAGLCTLKSAHPHEAKHYFEKALTEDPNRSTSLIELAEVNYKLGNYLLARKELDQYLRSFSPTAQTYYLEKQIDGKLNS